MKKKKDASFSGTAYCGRPANLPRQTDLFVAQRRLIACGRPRVDDLEIELRGKEARRERSTRPLFPVG
ncbi:MAG: hypothetical protein SF339_03010 [Blastocatellia bacterium]|nr:hypothetical protein [Blastocatellia bacterium]